MGRVYFTLPEGTNLQAIPYRYKGAKVTHLDIYIVSKGHMLYRSNVAIVDGSGWIEVGIGRKGCYIEHSQLPDEDLTSVMSLVGRGV